MDLFLTLFERQMKLSDLGEDLLVPYLSGAQPSDVTSLNDREPEQKCRDYSHIRGRLLQRFILTAEQFRELFSRNRKSPTGTWKDYYFEIRVSLRKPERPPKREYSRQVPNERSPFRCYGCGKQGVIKSKCPTCNLNASQRTDLETNGINSYTAQTRSPRLTQIDITFCGIKLRVCSDTGSSHSIAGKRMFQIFKDKGLIFLETRLAISLADGQQTTGDALTRNSAGLVLDVTNTCWVLWDNPTHKYPFGEELDTPSKVEKMSSNTCQLREGEGGEATNILEHHINTGNSPPTSVPPYRMSPVKKEILRKEVEDLLEKDIIKECKSHFGNPCCTDSKAK
ncbi:uncharacterized protein TNCV_3318811 [Trichonephila clavipes]|nr:uncharacterized protein TNCV_3318811 [Trichonephila clavipes]